MSFRSLDLCGLSGSERGLVSCRSPSSVRLGRVKVEVSRHDSAGQPVGRDPFTKRRQYPDQEFGPYPQNLQREEKLWGTTV